MAAPGNEVPEGTVSLWEAAIKIHIGQLAVEIPALSAGCVRVAFRLLDLSPLPVARLMRLPPPDEQRHASDHPLLAQAAPARAQFVKADARLAGFGVAILPAG